MKQQDYTFSSMGTVKLLPLLYLAAAPTWAVATVKPHDTPSRQTITAQQPEQTAYHASYAATGWMPKPTSGGTVLNDLDGRNEGNWWQRQADRSLWLNSKTCGWYKDHPCKLMMQKPLHMMFVQCSNSCSLGNSYLIQLERRYAQGPRLV